MGTARSADSRSIRPSQCRLPVGTLQPLRQGAFDHLCGLYAIINALRLLLAPTRPLRRPDARRLFACGVGHLSAQHDLGCTLLTGCSRTRWRGLLARLLAEAGRITGYDLATDQPFEDVERPSAAAVMAAIEYAIIERCPVLIELTGGTEHHSVVTGYTATHLSLFDSGRFVWLPRTRCVDDPPPDGQDLVLDLGSPIMLTLR